MYKANVTKAKTHNKEDVKIKNKSRKEPAGFLSLSPLLVVRFKIENKQNNTKQIIQSKNKSLSSHLFPFFNICHSSGVSQEPAGFSSFPLLVVVGDVDLGGVVGIVIVVVVSLEFGTRINPISIISLRYSFAFTKFSCTVFAHGLWKI